MVDEVLPVPGKSPCGAPTPVRYPLSDERKSRTCKFSLATQDDDGKTKAVDGYFTVSFYDDGTPGELFIDMGKQGHEMNGFANCWAIAMSMLLQYGVHPKKLYDKYKARDFTPNGITALRGVPIAKSVPDLVVRWMEANLPPTAVLEPSASDTDWSSLVEEVSPK